MTEVVAPRASVAVTEPYQYRWIALAVIVAGETMDLLDSLVTNVAGPSIRSDLAGGTSLIQWIGAGYTLAMAVALITGGRLGDMFGRSRMFMVGAGGFVVGSGLCALAQSPDMLIFARVLQGLFGALMLPQSFGLLREMFPPKEMVAALGAIGPIMALSTVGGPILAGWLIGANLFDIGWRMIFLINVPIGAVALVVAARYLPVSGRNREIRMDYGGVLLAAAAGALIIYPLVQGRELGWPAWVFVIVAAAMIVSAVFVVYERRLEARGGHPLLIGSLFESRAFPGGLATALVYFAAFVGFSLVFTLFVQLGLGYSPARAGIANAAPALAAVVGFGIVTGAELPQKHGRLVIQIGAVLAAIGAVAMFLTLQGTGTGVTLWKLTPALAVAGLGMGLVLAPFFDIVLAGVDERATGSAGGTLTAAQQLGSSLGIAVLGTIFFAALPGKVTIGADAVAPTLRADLTAAAVAVPQQNQIVAGLRTCAHDSAKTKDPSVVAPSCVQLQGLTQSATRPAPVAAAVERATKQVKRRGFSDVFQITLLVIAGLFALTFVFAFLLPPRARAPE